MHERQCPYCGSLDLHSTQGYVDPKTGNPRGYTPPTPARLWASALFLSGFAALFGWWFSPLLLPSDDFLLRAGIAALVGAATFAGLLRLHAQERRRMVLGTSTHAIEMHYFACNSCGHSWTWRAGQDWPHIIHPVDLNPLYAAAPPGTLRKLKRAWLEEDLRLLLRLWSLLPPQNGSVSQALPRNTTNPDADKEFGFGGHHAERTYRNGYTVWTLRALSWDDGLVRLHATCQVSGKEAEALASALIAFWGGDLEQSDPTTFSVAWADETRFAAFEQRVAVELGELEPIELPDDLVPAYTLLTSLDSRLHVGEVCYYAATKPTGRVAIETLQASGRADLIRNVLRGLNPEGRVYAAQALLALVHQGTPLDPRDAAAIETLRAQPTPIMVCMGCEVHAEPAAGLLPPLLNSVSHAQPV